MEKRKKYDDLVSTFKRVLVEKLKTIQRGGRRRKHTPKFWWDSEVKTAIVGRRWAKKKRDGPDEVASKWDAFQKSKKRGICSNLDKHC